jgi:hypothetical protein
MVLGSVIVSLAAIWLLLAFRGDLDSGRFEILQAESVSQTRIAMLVERSDNTALSGNAYFVVIGSHLYSAAELRKALYGSGAVFVVGRPGISLHWQNLKELVISCEDCAITKDTIQKQKWSDKGISISYHDFP